MNDHATLVHLLATRSAKKGQFTLSSGAKSELYIDARITTMSPEGLSLIGPLGLREIESDWKPDSVGGLTLGADPISYAISYASALQAANTNGSTPIRAFTVRKEVKQHGTGRQIEGPFEATDRVVVIEDVITTGGSSIKAINAIKAAGATVVGLLALVDREEGGRQAIEATGVEVRALVTASEILKYL